MIGGYDRRRSHMKSSFSRRDFFAFAAAAITLPASAFSQGAAPQQPAAGQGQAQGRGQGRGQQPPAPPLELPFEATNWKCVWLDHLDYQCVDYKKAAAWYASLMNWKVRSDDGKQAVLDIGENSGGIIIRGGLTAPPPAAITDAGLGVDKPKIQAVFDGFAWGIDPWDPKKVKADLEKRGLKPVADNHGDYQSFRFQDPDGFNVAVTNGTKANRRKAPAKAKLPAPPPFEFTDFNTLFLDHISFEVWNPRKSAAFYQALLGWNVRPGTDNMNVQIGDIAGAIIRGNADVRAASRGGNTPTAVKPSKAAIGHISFGIQGWNTDKVRDELMKRDVVYVTNGKREPRPDMTGNLQSFHVPDAMGWDLQIGNKTSQTQYNQ
jgi:predicted enzyme related to lactoylglutathione lyase